jgi:hypothetical protein
MGETREEVPRVRAPVLRGGMAGCFSAFGARLQKSAYGFPARLVPVESDFTKPTLGGLVW